MESWQEQFADSAFRRSADIAHDLKTPLNIAVLNLELLRMRLPKQNGDELDEKTSRYLSGIETELRRMARIFDAFFVNSVPPRETVAPSMIQVVPILKDALSKAGFERELPVADAIAPIHEARWREACRLFAEGVRKIFDLDLPVLEEARMSDRYRFSMTGATSLGEVELGKLFKFYYTDPSGNPDLSMATARLIVETYGGGLEIRGESSPVTVELSLALGDR